MSANTTSGANKGYILGVSVLTFGLPLAAAVIENLLRPGSVFSFELIWKWFIFSAVGLRLLAAGIKQIKDPAFTAKQIFQIETTEVLPVVGELGFANLCFSLVGIVSVFLPQWRIVSAFASGIYYGIAGVQHLVKKPAGVNELFALVTDILIFAVLAVYFVVFI
jgi:hypothetical protein